MTITNSSDIIGTGRGERELTGAGDLAESGTESISNQGGRDPRLAKWIAVNIRRVWEIVAY